MAERVHLIRIGYGYAITGSLPPAAIGDPYSRTLTAIGGVGIKRLEILAENVTDAIVFTDNSDNTATFAMADPQTAGTYSVTVRATDANRQRWTRTFTFQVVALPLAMSGSLANCTVGSAYSDTLTVSGGVQPYSLDSYTLPAGLSAMLAGDTITISGTPTGAGLGPGTSFNFGTNFSVSDSIAGGVEYAQTITISVTAVVTTFDGGALPDAEADDAYSHDADATGGTGGYTFTKQTGPAWLSVNSSTGALTGTPDSGDVGTGITVTVRATDSEGNYDDVTDTIDVGLGYDPVARAIYDKLVEWWTCNADGASITGEINSTVASKIVTTGSVTAVAGHIGNALDNTPDCLYRATSLPFTPATGSVYALGIWIRADGLSTVPAPFIIGQSDNINGTDRALQMIVLSGGQFIARAGNDVGGFDDATTSSGAVTTGAWHFLQAERGTNYVRARVNGGSWVSTSITANTVPVTSQAISLGGDYNSSAPTLQNSLDGKFDEAFVATAVLTDSEWTYLYNGGAGLSHAALKALAGY